MKNSEIPYRQWLRNKKEFYGFLLSQASTIGDAEIFFRKWRDEMGQELPIWGMFSLRSMAGHLSNALEGHIEKSLRKSILKSYMETKYGTTIYFS